MIRSKDLCVVLSQFSAVCLRGVQRPMFFLPSHMASLQSWFMLNGIYIQFGEKVVLLQNIQTVFIPRKKTGNIGSSILLFLVKLPECSLGECDIDKRIQLVQKQLVASSTG